MLSHRVCSISCAVLGTAKRLVEAWVGLVFFVGARAYDEAVGGDSCSNELSYCSLAAANSASIVASSLSDVSSRHARISPQKSSVLLAI